MAHRRCLSRRAALRAGAVGAMAVFAGCVGDGGSSGTTTPTDRSVVRAVSVDGADLVVALADNNDVSQLNLIGPDGTTTAQATVPMGATTARLQLLDITTGTHYSPGSHELGAVADGTELATRAIDLAPTVRVTDVAQYEGGDPTATNRGNVAVTVENAGTGPTWVYDVAFRDAPYDPATTIAEDPTLPTTSLAVPDTQAATILDPQTERRFVGTQPPFILDRDTDCDGRSVAVTALVATGSGAVVEQPIEATLRGERLTSTFRTTCSDITVALAGGDDADG
jgi:hypothetical protein